MADPATNNTTKKRWTRHPSFMVACANCGKKTRKYVSRVSKTRVGTTDNINMFSNHYCSRRCYLDAKSNGMSLPEQGGEKNPHWRGGLSAVPYVCKKCGKSFMASAANRRQYCSPECWYQTIEKPENGRTLRRRPGYWSWRSHTMKKYNYLCAACGGHANHAHHILPIKDYPELRVNAQNGMALCEKHHAAFHRGIAGGGVTPQNSWLCGLVFWNEWTLGMSNQPGGAKSPRYFTKAGSEDSRMTGRIPLID